MAEPTIGSAHNSCHACCGLVHAGRSRKIFVGGLAPSVDDAMLREHFGVYGEVEDAVVSG